MCQFWRLRCQVSHASIHRGKMYDCAFIHVSAEEVRLAMSVHASTGMTVHATN